MSTVWDVGEQDDEEEEVDVGWSPQDPWDPLTIDDPDIDLDNEEHQSQSDHQDYFSCHPGHNLSLHNQESLEEVQQARERSSMCGSSRSCLCLSTGSSPLSEYLCGTSSTEHYSEGYVGHEKYVVPLHVLSVAPGHVVRRLGLFRTETTVDHKDAIVVCFDPSPVMSLGTPMQGLAKLISRTTELMDKNQFLPYPATVMHYDAMTKSMSRSLAPLTLGNKISMSRLATEDLVFEHEDRSYTVPTGCNTKSYTKPSGLGSSMVINNVVLMYHDVQQKMISSDLRKIPESYNGFLCCCSAPSSASTKGTIKYLASGTTIRSYNSGVRDHLLHLFKIIDSIRCPCETKDGGITMSGKRFSCCSVCLCLVTKACTDRSKMTPHCVTISTNGSISFCTGTVMRYDRTLRRWVDSNTITDGPTEYETGLSHMLRLTPFIDFINPTRAGLLPTFLQQAICNPGSTYDPRRTVVPLYQEIPVLSPRSLIEEQMSVTDIPGLNLFVILCDKAETYEDGIVMSASAAARFRYFCRRTVILSATAKIPKIGDRIQPFAHPWWQVAFEGRLVSVEITRLGTVRLVFDYIGLPVNGDKFTTLHGQKGVVTILQDDLMPQVVIQSTGLHRVAEIVIGSSAVIRRDTVSQLLEAALGMFCRRFQFEDGIYDDKSVIQAYGFSKFSYTSKTPNIHEAALRDHQGPVYMPGDDGTKVLVSRKVWSMNSNIHSVEPVKANYGIIRVMQSIFMASSKMSCTQMTSKAHHLQPCTPRGGGGSKAMGEMDLCQLEAVGMKHCLAEVASRSDMCIVQVCGSCQCLTILCGCDQDRRDRTGTFKAALPLSSVKCMIGTRVCVGKNTRLWPELEP